MISCFVKGCRSESYAGCGISFHRGSWLSACTVFAAFFRHVSSIYAFRANLSVAIVMMTDKNDPDHFDWSLMTQSIVLSSFYWGYVVLQVAGGELAKRFGGKILLIVSAAIDSTVLIFLPTGARLGGWQLVCVCRLIQGLGQGVVYPAMYQLVGQWIPLQERGTFVSVIFSGAHLGVAFQLAVSGFIAYSLGWPSIFYVTGAIGIIWVCAYVILGSDSPEKSRYISNNELLYIQKSLGARKFKRYPTPWLKINTSLPFWALVVAHCGQNWGYFTLMAEMPTYMAKVLGVDIKTNGVLSSLPYLTMFTMAFVFGALTDVILKRNWLNVTKTRKLFNSIATIGAAIGLIGLAYTPPNNKVLAEILLIIALGFSVGQLVGFTLVHMDMSPNFRATMMGITNTWSNIVSILGPLFCGLILKDETNYLEWRAVFYVSAAVYFGCNLFFVLFGTSKRQPWNEPKEEIATSSNASRQDQSVK